MNAKISAGADGAPTIKIADAEKLYRKYGPMVLRRCLKLLCNDDEAADATQDVFAKLLAHRNSLTAKYPSSLLYTIATNHCLNLLRDREKHGGNFNIDENEVIAKIACAGEDIEERTHYRGILRRIFKRHPRSSRTIAVLHYFDGMTLEETAKEVRMSVSGVRKRLRILRETLTETKTYTETEVYYE